MEHSDNEQRSPSDDARSFSGQSDSVKNMNDPDTLLPTMLARLGLGKSSLPPGTETRVDQLVAALDNRDWSIRVAAVQALGRLGERAPIKSLMASIKDENDLVRAAAARALGMLKKRAPVEPLVAALRDSSWQVRADAALALGELGERAPIEPLVAAINDEDGSVCAAAAQALGEMGERAPVEPLVIALHDQEWFVREAAALALGKLGERAPVDDLMAALEDKDEAVRKAAMLALQQTHPDVLSEINSRMPTLLLEQGEQEPGTEVSSQSQQDDADSAEHEAFNGRNSTLLAHERLYSIFTTMNLKRSGSERPLETDIDQSGVDRYQINLPNRHTVARPVRFTQQLFPPQRGRVRRAVEASMAVLVVASIIIASLTIFTRLRTTTGSGGNNSFCSQGVGCAYFMSSDITQSNGAGINDKLEIDLHNIPDPAAGKSYYAWLLSDNPEGGAIPLGKLQVVQGSVKILYPGDAEHTNLLLDHSQFLITEEDANITPVNPSLDRSTWRYYAGLSSTPNPSDRVNHYSLVDHLRHLLAKDPELEPLGLHGGLSIWLLRNTGQILTWAHSARDAWQKKDTQLMHSEFIRTLDYLDGQAYVQQDVPRGTPLLVDAKIARVALLEFDPARQEPPGYLDHIGVHLRAIAQNPDATAYQKALANQINEALNKINTGLEKVRQDAKLLVNMSNTQLLQPSSQTILNDMVTQASDVYNGQASSSTQQAQQEGVVQLYKDIQRLAVFDVQPYKQ